MKACDLSGSRQSLTTPLDLRHLDFSIQTTPDIPPLFDSDTTSGIAFFYTFHRSFGACSV